MVKTLRKMPYAQAKVRDYSDIGRDTVILQSYSTDVIIVKMDGMYRIIQYDYKKAHQCFSIGILSEH